MTGLGAQRPLMSGLQPVQIAQPPSVDISGMINAFKSARDDAKRDAYIKALGGNPMAQQPPGMFGGLGNWLGGLGAGSAPMGAGASMPQFTGAPMTGAGY